MGLRIAEDYVRLRSAFAHRSDQESFSVAMEELAQVLCCTTRNAKIIITKMEQEQWIIFRSGRGRGHTSELTFLLPIATILLEEAKERVIQGDVQDAFDWLQAHETLAVVRPQFLEWLIAYFGYKTQQIGQDRIIETLRLPIYRPIVSLHPANAMYSFDTHLIHQIFSRLVEYDPIQQNFTKSIAHHWEKNEDATHWTFYLVKGVRFHHGQELTAQDVCSSLTQLRHPSVIHHWIGKEIKQIEVINRYQLRIELQRQNHQFLFYLSHSAASILPSSEIVQSNEQTLPIGSGAYQVVSRHKGKCTLELFSSYFGYSGLIDRIEIIIVPENEAEACFGTSPGVLTVVTGEFNIPSDLNMPLKQTITGVSTLTFNLRKSSPLQHLALRNVLVQAIDRQQMIQELGETRLYPAQGLQIESESQQAFPKEATPDESDSLVHAEHILAQLKESVYAEEILHLYTFYRHARDAYWLQQQYQQYGIVVEVHIIDWSEMLQPALMEQADLILFEAVLSEGPIRLLEYVQSDRNFIRHSLSDKIKMQLDDLTHQMLASVETNAVQQWSTAVAALLKDEYTSAFLVVRTSSTIYHRSLQGVEVNAKGWVNFDRLWFHEH